MQKDIFFFDLDGTITKSDMGIKNSIIYALTQLGMPVPDLSTHNDIVGPPLNDIFIRYFGFNEDNVHMAVEKYREYYREKGMFESELYAGIDKILENLYESGKTIILATSKAEFFAKKVLAYFDLVKYFSYISGTALEGRISTKAELIRRGLIHADTKDPSRAIVIGDRKYDILGAKENGMDSVGVLFGYGSRAELTGAGATYIAETTGELYELLLAT